MLVSTILRLGLAAWCCFETSEAVQSVNQQPLAAHQAHQQPSEGGSGSFKPVSLAPPYRARQLPRAAWTVLCNGTSSAECNSTINGDDKTCWTSPRGTDTRSYNFTIDLKSLNNVSGIGMTPADDCALMTAHQVWVSKTPGVLGELVAYGTWHNDDLDKDTFQRVKYSSFEPVQGRYITLTALPTPLEYCVQQLDVFFVSKLVENPRGGGKWGPTIDFPVTPAGIWVDPTTGNVITFSSDSHTGYVDKVDVENQTQTAIWSPAGKSVTPKLVDVTEHNMFCPGMSFDVNGNMVITGGQTSQKTSIYNTTTGAWKLLANMNIARGYQGQTTCADGRVFIIGGSWSPEDTLEHPRGNRTGEVYDPRSNKWTKLNNCPPKNILTADWDYRFRADNHVWLFGWKNNSIFHAGPSRRMNWITTSGNGSITTIGNRTTSNGFADSDAMCGVAVMYDAKQGLILTAGGAPHYKMFDGDGENKPTCSIPEPAKPTPLDLPTCVQRGNFSTNNAFLIKLNRPGAPVSVTAAGGGHMKYPRQFHHAVILPNGNTLVVGGQWQGQPWTDQTPQLTPEMFISSSTGGTWQDMTPNSTPRTYHSFAVLLPDATVLVGGGGLCGTCPVNHNDAQIYTPAYLLSGAARPVIKQLSPATGIRPASVITFVTDREISTASIIRYSAATHSLNNDQRRIPLDLARKTGSANTYTATIDADGGVALPGFWMLFVMDANGVPSKAWTFQILVGLSK